MTWKGTSKTYADHQIIGMRACAGLLDRFRLYGDPESNSFRKWPELVEKQTGFEFSSNTVQRARNAGNLESLRQQARPSNAIDVITREYLEAMSLMIVPTLNYTQRQLITLYNGCVWADDESISDIVANYDRADFDRAKFADDEYYLFIEGCLFDKVLKKGMKLTGLSRSRLQQAGIVQLYRATWEALYTEIRSQLGSPDFSSIADTLKIDAGSLTDKDIFEVSRLFRALDKEEDTYRVEHLAALTIPGYDSIDLLTLAI